MEQGRDRLLELHSKGQGRSEQLVKDIESLDDLIDLVKSDRNKYEIFSGRDKVY